MLMAKMFHAPTNGGVACSLPLLGASAGELRSFRAGFICGLFWWPLGCLCMAPAVLCVLDFIVVVNLGSH